MVPPPSQCYPSDFFDALTSIEDVKRVVGDFEDLLFDNSDDADFILQNFVSYERPEIVRVVLSCKYSSVRFIRPHLILQ